MNNLHDQRSAELLLITALVSARAPPIRPASSIKLNIHSWRRLIAPLCRRGISAYRRPEAVRFLSARIPSRFSFLFSLAGIVCFHAPRCASRRCMQQHLLNRSSLSLSALSIRARGCELRSKASSRRSLFHPSASLKCRVRNVRQGQLESSELPDSALFRSLYLGRDRPDEDRLAENRRKISRVVAQAFKTRESYVRDSSGEFRARDRRSHEKLTRQRVAILHSAFSPRGARARVFTDEICSYFYTWPACKCLPRAPRISGEWQESSSGRGGNSTSSFFPGE